MSDEPDEFTAFLREDDERSRPFRARRLELIACEFGQPRLLVLPGGPVSSYAFEEARHAYIRGLDVGTVLLSQTVLEHMLAGLLRMAGHDGDWGFVRVLRLARDERLISEAEFELFDRLRELRNPYVHARVPLAPGTLGRRSIERGNFPDDAELMEEDATMAITALLGIVQREPFAVDPDLAEAGT